MGISDRLPFWKRLLGTFLALYVGNLIFSALSVFAYYNPYSGIEELRYLWGFLGFNLVYNGFLFIPMLLPQAIFGTKMFQIVLVVVVVGYLWFYKTKKSRFVGVAAAVALAIYTTLWVNYFIPDNSMMIKPLMGSVALIFSGATIWVMGELYFRTSIRRQGQVAPTENPSASADQPSG